MYGRGTYLQANIPYASLIVSLVYWTKVVTMDLPIVHDYPICVQLGHAIRAPRVERRLLILGRSGHLTIQLGRGGLIELDQFFH
jgi:hypothetical protein